MFWMFCLGVWQVVGPTMVFHGGEGEEAGAAGAQVVFLPSEP